MAVPQTTCGPREENMGQEGLLMVNWARNYNQSLATLANGGLPSTLHFQGRGAGKPLAPPHCSCLMNHPYRRVSGIKF